MQQQSSRRQTRPLLQRANRPSTYRNENGLPIWGGLCFGTLFHSILRRFSEVALQRLHFEIAGLQCLDGKGCSFRTGHCGVVGHLLHQRCAT